MGDLIHLLTLGRVKNYENFFNLEIEGVLALFIIVFTIIIGDNHLNFIR